MTPEQARLIERVRTLTADQLMVREVPMFGGRAVMVNDKIIVSALKDGGLLVRVDADRDDEFLEGSGAERATMGRGRSMGPGWIRVSADAISDDEQLSSWIDVAVDHNRAVTVGRR